MEIGGTHEYWMRMAIREAAAALDHDDVPVGAVIVREGRILGRAHNQRELLRDPTAHAEMIALTQAGEALGTWRLEGAVLYVTLEPCPMCAGALVNARLPLLVYGAEDPKAGACGSVLDVVRHPKLNHQVEVVAGVMANDCAALLVEFFRGKRGKNDGA